MASNSNTDNEDATQHLRDILKLNRPGNSADVQSSDSQRKPSFNGELNGLLGIGGLLGDGDQSAMTDSTRPISDMGTQECQIICLSGDDGSTCVPIISENVEIVASQDSSINSKARGSNKVKIQPVAKYDWEHKYHYGRLIAVSNSFLAYAIRGGPNNHAMIRVLSLVCAERTLLKGFTGAVTDLAFAHLDSSLLGCLDEAGNLVVWQLTCTSGKILDQVVVHIRRPEETPLNSHRRLIWCPFIPDDNEENQDDASQTLALLHEDRAEVWDLDVLRANNSSWPIDATDLKDGLITIKGHTQRVSEGALSPDGTVLATASHDGTVKFWQIYIEGTQDKPRCLHELRPHGGRPLSCLLFCDNHKKQDPDVPFWRFLITGADQNQELKIWCTVSWTCLQTTRFSPDPFNSSVLPSLKASLDLSAEFLILTDVQRKVLYVMELRQDLEKGNAHFTAVSEFLLTHPVLSFGVRDVTQCRLRHTEVLPAEEESESITTEGSQGQTESKSGIQIKLYCVHTKSLQDVQIWFQPNLGSNSTAFLPHLDSQGGFAGFADHLTEQITDKESGSGSQNDLRKIPSLPAPTDFLIGSGTGSRTMPKLMTPDAFMTPSTSVPASPGSSASSLTIVTATSSNSDSTISSPRAASVLLPGLDNIQTVMSPSGPLCLDTPQVLDSALLPPLASPTRARSPDVISSVSTAISQDMPEIASQLQRALVSNLEPLPLSALQTDSMASAASALHLLTSPRSTNNSSLLPPELGGADGALGGAVDPEPRLSHTPSLLEIALSQENTGVGGGASDGSVSHTPWPAAPDITRETRNSLRDNGLGDCSREELNDRHPSSPYHRRSYLSQNDNRDPSAEQSDPDDEMANLASPSGNCGTRSSHRLPVKDWKTSPRDSPKLKRRGKKEEGDSSLSRQMDSSQVNAEVQEELFMLLRGQQRELVDLRVQIEAMQSSIMAQVDRALANHQEQEQRRLERMLAESRNQQQQLQEHLGQQLSQTLSSALSNRMDRVIRDEMKKTVPQTIAKSLEPVTGQLNNTVSAKLAAVEISLKDNVSKVVKSKNTTDAIGRAAAEAMQGPIQAAYKDAFQSIVLPVFERGCQSMFVQINDSFKQGTQEYIQQLETHIKNKNQKDLEARDPMIGQLQQMIDGFQRSTDQLASNITTSVQTEVQHQIQMMVGNLQDSILSHVQRIVKTVVSLAMKEQQAAVTSSIMQAMRSAASTPVPTAHLDYQTQQANILQLLQQGQLNQAFQQALSATDLNLVLYVCETIDSQQVFGQHPCPLSQPVLLSLIQQLSSNLATHSELKISYLEDAVMNLDHSDPLTRDHISAVLSQVRPKLFAFLQQDPHSPISKRARRLMMMLQGLVNH
ncbi:enhancer of mRNA-decapping protein 4 isoform X2 [Genypterus blacodes]|uniref:enhancer of mRNA-decapping protein 4 isoform X2 n=1 Tax=Genypterus blacodes TaxID=154954 RepID=UPI003F757A79